MSAPPFPGFIRTFAAMAVAVLLPVLAQATSFTLSTSNGVETLRIQLDAPGGDLRATRVGRTEVSARVGDGARPARQDLGGKLVSSASVSGGQLSVSLATPAFGYIAIPDSSRRSLEIKFFNDPLGARWQAGTSAKPEPESKSPQVKAPPKTEAKPEPAARSEAKPKAAQPELPPKAAAKVEPASPAKPGPPVSRQPQVEPQPVAGPKSEVAAPAGPEPKQPAQASEIKAPVTRQPAVQAPADPAVGLVPQPEPNDSPGEPSGKRPFYAVPYALRAPVQFGGPESAKQYSSQDSSKSEPSAATAPAGEHPALPSPLQADSQSPEPAHSEERPVEPMPGHDPMFRNSDDEVPAVRMSVGGGAASAPSTAPAEPAAGAKPQGAPSGKEQAPAVEAPATRPDGASANGDGAAGTPGNAAPAPSESEQREPSQEPDGPKANEVPGKAQSVGKAMGAPDDQGVESQFEAAQRHIINGELAPAVKILEPLAKRTDLDAGQHEEILYVLADSLYELHAKDLSGHYAEIQQAIEEAMSFNPKSPQVPSALLRMGLLNLRVGNVPEARAYFGILEKKHPRDQNLPMVHYAWGEHYFAKGDWQKAADSYQRVVQDYPDSEIIREASLGLARSLEKLQYYDQAFQIVEFIDKRWPRFYVESPEFLRLSAELSNQLGNLEEAKSDYWAYVNLEPEAAGNDVILARIGDIYLRGGQKDAAREIYQEVAAKYPEEEGGLVAQMRLAEEGIHDSPTLDEMSGVFDRPFTAGPEEIYRRILDKYPNSELAPLAQLKLAMWQLLNNRVPEALESVNEFQRRWPENPLGQRARDVGLKAFDSTVTKLAAEENFPRIVDLWDRYGFLRVAKDELKPGPRIALATAMWKTGLPGEALDMVQPLLGGEKQGEASEMAMSLALGIYLDRQAWSDIARIGEASAGWELPGRQRRELDYARALAHENLSQQDKSHALWTKIASDNETDPLQRAYAMYYLAQNARAKNEMRGEYLYAQEALALFMQHKGDEEKIKDCLLLLMDVTRRSNRLEESLRWARMYDERLDESDPDWPASRFRLADITHDLGDTEGWKLLLTELSTKKPDTLYGRMAASALQAKSLEGDARRFNTGRQ